MCLLKESGEAYLDNLGNGLEMMSLVSIPSISVRPKSIC